MNKFFTMLKTELKLSIRGMDMIIFALCMPVVVVVILGVIYGNKPAAPGSEYTFLQQSFGALSTIAICAGGIMGLPLVISDYRQKRILKRFKVTPTSPALLLAVQVAIYALYSLVSLALLILVAALFFGFRFPGSWGLFFAAYLLVMLSTFSIGMMVGASDLLPLTQGIKLLKAISLGLPLESVWLPIIVMLTFLLICGGVSIKFFRWE